MPRPGTPATCCAAGSTRLGCIRARTSSYPIAEAAFSDPDLFRAWRKRAETEAPRSVKAFLAAEGDAIQVRLDGPGPYATGTIERSLSGVRKALVPGHGRVRNLPAGTSGWR